MICVVEALTRMLCWVAGLWMKRQRATVTQSGPGGAPRLGLLLCRLGKRPSSHKALGGVCTLRTGVTAPAVSTQRLRLFLTWLWSLSPPLEHEQRSLSVCWINRLMRRFSDAFNHSSMCVTGIHRTSTFYYVWGPTVWLHRGGPCMDPVSRCSESNRGLPCEERLKELGMFRARRS